MSLSRVILTKQNRRRTIRNNIAHLKLYTNNWTCVFILTDLSKIRHINCCNYIFGFWQKQCMTRKLNLSTNLLSREVNKLCKRIIIPQNVALFIF